MRRGLKMKDMHKWIKSVIDTTYGLSQKGLAAAMDLNPAAVNRMLHGKRAIKVDEVPVIETYLGQKWVPKDRERKSAPGVYRESSDVFAGAGPANQRTHDPDQNVIFRAQSNFDMVPVFGVSNAQGVIILDTSKPVDWVPRHPRQNGLDNSYAFYIHETDMQPRYFPGELVYLHPARPPENGRDCLVVYKDGKAVIRNFVKRDGENVVLRQYNLPHDETVSTGDIKILYSIIGRS